MSGTGQRSRHDGNNTDARRVQDKSAAGPADGPTDAAPPICLASTDPYPWKITSTCARTCRSPATKSTSATTPTSSRPPTWVAKSPMPMRTSSLSAVSAKRSYGASRTVSCVTRTCRHRPSPISGAACVAGNPGWGWSRTAARTAITTGSARSSRRSAATAGWWNTSRCAPGHNPSRSVPPKPITASCATTRAPRSWASSSWACAPASACWQRSASCSAAPWAPCSAACRCLPRPPASCSAASAPPPWAAWRSPRCGGWRGRHGRSGTIRSASGSTPAGATRSAKSPSP